MADTTPAPERLPYGSHPDQFVDLYHPPTGESRGTVMSIHGGYWRSRYGLELNEAISRHLAGRGWTVANVEYRRIEPDGQPAWDVMAADLIAAALLAKPKVAIGHSAGGQLALWLASRPEVGLDAVVALAPVADLIRADRQRLSDHATLELFGGTADQLPEVYEAASPQALIPQGLPQLVVHGRGDEHVPFSQASDYVSAASEAGDPVDFLDWPTIDHFDVIDPNHEVWRHIDRWIDEVSSPCW